MLISAGMKFRNKKKFRYSIPAYTSRFRALHIRLGCLRGNRQRQVVTFKTGKKVKAKQSHNAPMEAQRERRYSSYSFSTSALYGGEWSASCLVRGKDPQCPLYRKLGGSQSRSEQRLEEKSSCLSLGSNLDGPVVQSVAKHYTLTPPCYVFGSSLGPEIGSCSVASLSIF
jgi:hypothetical protein